MVNCVVPIFDFIYVLRPCCTKMMTCDASPVLTEVHALNQSLEFNNFVHCFEK